MRRRTGALVAATAVAGTALIALLGLMGGGVAGQPAPTVPIGATVYPPFGLTLQPGESITVPGETPTPAPTAAPALTPETGFATPPPILVQIAHFDVQIVNDSQTQITVLGDGNNFTVTAYDGSILQLVTSHPLDHQSALSPLSSCGPDDAQGNVVRCRGLNATLINQPPVGDGPLVLHVTTAPQDSTDQQLDLAPGDTAFLVWPQADATSGPGPAIGVSNTANSSASIDWDGSTFNATVADGEAIDGRISGRMMPGSSFAEAGCTNPNGPNSVSCAVSGLPQQQISINSLSLAPSQPLTLPYADRYSQGTLSLTPSGPDPAPGGESVAATLIAGGAEFDGSGVLRPEPRANETFQLRLTLSDGASETWNVEGVLAESNGIWAGCGAIVMANDPSGVSSWSAGDASRAAAMSGDYSAGAILAGPYGEPGLPLLPALLDGQLSGGPSPTAGKAGQPVSFLVTAEGTSLGGPETHGIDFGDGTPPQESAQQEITHTFAAPGTYTLFSYIIDASGERSFGVTQITITSASP